MDTIEKRARQLLAKVHAEAGWPGCAKEILQGAATFDVDHGLAMAAIVAALMPPEGQVVVTRNEAGQAVAVTRQDDEGRILSVIAEFEPPERSDQSLLELAAVFDTCIPFLPPAGQRNIGKAVAQLQHMAMGYVLVPVEPTKEMVLAACKDHGFPCGDRTVYARGYRSMLAARPEVP